MAPIPFVLARDGHSSDWGIMGQRRIRRNGKKRRKGIRNCDKARKLSAQILLAVPLGKLRWIKQIPAVLVH
jgi:hypothetical protein